MKELAKDENIPPANLEKIIGEYLYTQKLPREQEIVDLLPEEQQPRILERQSFVDRIRKAIENIVDKFEW